MKIPVYKLFSTVGVVVILSIPAWAQHTRFEVGVKGGSSGGGVEVCAWCSGSFALFGDASGWPAPQRKSADTVGVGLRFQRLGGICPDGFCFLDVGIASINGPSVSTSGTRSRRRSGGIFGGGVWIPITQRFYVRPQVRLYPGGDDSTASAEVAFGWRF